MVVAGLRVRNRIDLCIACIVNCDFRNLFLIETLLFYLGKRNTVKLHIHQNSQEKHGFTVSQYMSLCTEIYL